MRMLIGLTATFALFMAAAQPAAASCAPPAPLSENASRAVAVVFGTVTGGDHNRVTIRVDRLLKGSVGSTVAIHLGPERGGGATSVDYVARIGSEHVLYLVRAQDGQLETNACIGSHAGPPTAEETAFFGPGTTPSAASDPPTLRGLTQTTWVVAAVVLGGLLLIAVVTARRRARTVAR